MTQACVNTVHNEFYESTEFMHQLTNFKLFKELPQPNAQAYVLCLLLLLILGWY
jgi:hypothetical protein